MNTSAFKQFLWIFDDGGRVKLEVQELLFLHELYFNQINGWIIQKNIFSFRLQLLMIFCMSFAVNLSIRPETKVVSMYVHAE